MDTRINQLNPGQSIEMTGLIFSLAEDIYIDVYGVMDNRHFYATKCGEIQEWLENSDAVAERNYDDLLAEWRDYDTVDIDYHGV